MKTTTLCFRLRGDEVLLAMKKRGFGAGKWNGPGGKLEPGETPRQAMVREARQEVNIGLHEENLQQVAIVDFFFVDDHVFECHVFVCKEWDGEPSESEEMCPEWFPKNMLPFSDMWVADQKWIPEILMGRTIRARIQFDKTGDKLQDIRVVDTIFS